MEFQNRIEKKDLKKRPHPREEDMRGHYFRDATAIIHSYPFRRLKHKTQVFFAPKNDHICTRIEHSLHVSTIAATICKALQLNIDLSWAIGLGHDLGHSPFGHVGEMALDEILKESGGFQHEIYSLRVVDYLINYGKGLNLTYAVRDGIINHCGEKFEQAIMPDFKIKELNTIVTRSFYPSTWEGAVVRVSDKIAYMGRDLEDALGLHVIKKEQIPPIVLKRLGHTNSRIIDTLVNDLITTSLRDGKIGFCDEKFEAMLELRNFNYTNIYSSPILVDYHRYLKRILRSLYSYLVELFNQCSFDLTKYKLEHNILAARFGDFALKMQNYYTNVEKSFQNLVPDYIAGMTDDYAIDCVQEIMVPNSFERQFDESIFAN